MNTTTKNQETGTTVELGHKKSFGLDDEDFGWVTYCIDHEQFMGHRTQKQATRASSKPSGWCEACANLVH